MAASLQERRKQQAFLALETASSELQLLGLPPNQPQRLKFRDAQFEQAALHAVLHGRSPLIVIGPDDQKLYQERRDVLWRNLQSFTGTQDEASRKPPKR